jgi:hypothetical protein
MIIEGLRPRGRHGFVSSDNNGNDAEDEGEDEDDGPNLTTPRRGGPKRRSCMENLLSVRSTPLFASVISDSWLEEDPRVHASAYPRI